MNYDLELNREQAEAVRHTEGPVLILAGAGSGKTRTIVYRMAYLLSEKNISPWNILALTFTNKAAKEMKDRIAEMVPESAGMMNVGTFHSTCLRILFQHAEKLNYPSKFEIADTADQKNVIKNVYKLLSIDPKVLPEKMALNKISGAKDQLLTPDMYAEEMGYEFPGSRVAEIYREYQKELFKSGLMDFDDLIMNTVTLFKEFPEVLNHYQERFRYIMVDEYQDTNMAQFELIRLLAGSHGNLCVVGDDDQSIYRFRGANIYNILDFEQHFPDAFVVKLEENYRSTGNILRAANRVISHNTERKQKTLRTKAENGSRLRFKQLYNAKEEAGYIADEIRRKASEESRSYGDFAILTRTNIQSKELEDALRLRHMDYDVVKGLRFWDTKVIKDLTSYLLTVDNAVNDMRVRRIINIPKRGIGDKSIEKVSAFASANSLSFFDAMGRAGDIPGIPAKAKDAMKGLYGTLMSIRNDMPQMSFSEVLDRIIDETDYLSYLLSESETPERFKEQKEYIEKLKETLDSYVEETEEPDLTDFMRINGLEGLNLDKEGDGDSKDKVLIMTMHNAKGLEFPFVFMAGMEEGLFPGYASINSDDEMAIEEERRLCYVGITRAKEGLTLTAAKSRMVNGETRYSAISRFIREIPADLLENDGGFGRPLYSEDDVFSDRDAARRAFEEKPPAYSPGFKKSTSRGSSDFSVGTPIKKGSDMVKKMPDYAVGDTVMHFKLGNGKVISIKDGGRDYEVTVEFDSVGVRKMFAGFAKLKKV